MGLRGPQRERRYSGSQRPRGMIVSAIWGSDLIVFPGPLGIDGPLGCDGKSRSGGCAHIPAVRSPRPQAHANRAVSESRDVAATVRVLRPTRTPSTPSPDNILLDEPLRNDRPATVLGAISRSGVRLESMVQRRAAP